jgi:hypothetical protein
MTPRSIRRAAERKANKLARKSAQQGVLAPETHLTENQFPTEESPAESQPEIPVPLIISADEANAHLSAGVSPLTGQATLLPATDAAPYGQLLHDHLTQFQPIGLQESSLVQTLAETTWRMRRLVSLEMALFAKGRVEFAAQFAEHNSDLRPQLIDLHTFLTYEKQIRALQLQEARLSRRADKQTAELRALQQDRKKRDEHAARQQEEERRRQLEAAARLYQTAKQNRQPFDPAQNGFEFSNHEIEQHLAKKQAFENQPERTRPQAA